MKSAKIKTQSVADRRHSAFPSLGRGTAVAVDEVAPKGVPFAERDFRFQPSQAWEGGKTFASQSEAKFDG